MVFKSNKQNLYCDIDNTIADQYQKYKEIRKKNFLFKIEDTSKYDLKVLPFAKIVNSKLSKNFNIIMITARKKKYFKHTKIWLMKNKFSFKKIVLVKRHKDKIKYVESKLENSILIDDFKYDYENLRPKIMKRLIKSINKKKMNFIRFNNNWNSIYKIISKI
jgi:5'(3')-deoxyribonucleotidase